MINRVGNVQLMQKINRLKILNYIRENKIAFRPEIAKKTGLSLSSVTNIVTYLMSKDIIESDSGLIKNTVGRRADVLRFNFSAYNLVCVLVEHGALTVAFCDLSGEVIEKSVQKIKSETGEQLIENIVSNVKKMLGKYQEKKVLAVGIALSALVLKEEIYSAPLNLHMPLFRESLEEKIGVSVFVENITNTKAVWQFKGKEKVFDNVLFMDLDEGIGAVQFTDGSINRSAVGEIGHTTVEADGEACVCGNKGCLETICSYEKVLESCKKHGFSCVSDAETKGDKKEIFGRFIKYLGIGISNLVTIFNPQLIVINYGSFKKCPSILEMAVEEMRRRTHSIFTNKLVVKYADFTTDEIICGVALYMCDVIFSLDFEKGFIE